MTSEEALCVLNRIKDDNLNLDNLHVKDIYGALNIAIETIEREPKNGHWIDLLGFQKCSECGNVQFGYDRRFYCPICGAKMEKKESKS